MATVIMTMYCAYSMYSYDDDYDDHNNVLMTLLTMVHDYDEIDDDGS